MPIDPFAAVPAGASADVNDLFANLLEFRWRDIGFPVVTFELDLRQDLAIHKFADRDGAHVEATGRAPLQITAHIPFLNGLDKGKNETWQRPLYAFTWRKFFAACADRSSGVLQHPELGDITCKVESIRTRWDAHVRSGVYVDATWIESDDTSAQVDNALTGQSPLAQCQAAANDLDLQLSTLKKAVVPAPFVPSFLFGDLVFAIRGVFDTGTRIQKQFGGRIDDLMYQAQSLEDSINRFGNANALNWPLLAAIERLKSAAVDLKASLLNKARPIAFFTTTKDSTLAQVAASLGANVLDIMNLNPAYIQLPVLPSGSVVRYYTA